jgi:hypothetical protein
MPDALQGEKAGSHRPSASLGEPVKARSGLAGAPIGQDQTVCFPRLFPPKPGSTRQRNFRQLLSYPGCTDGAFSNLALRTLPIYRLLPDSSALSFPLGRLVKLKQYVSRGLLLSFHFLPIAGVLAFVSAVVLPLLNSSGCIDVNFHITPGPFVYWVQ